MLAIYSLSCHRVKRQKALCSEHQRQKSVRRTDRRTEGTSIAGAELVRSVQLTPRAQSAGVARHFVADVLRDAGHSNWSESAEVAVSEIVTNVILHAHTMFVVTVNVTDSCVTISVQDFSPGLPFQRHYTDAATTGRGLTLVSQLAAAHGVDVRPDGKVIWFVVDDSCVDRHGDLFAAYSGDDFELENFPEPTSMGTAWDLLGVRDRAERLPANHSYQGGTSGLKPGTIITHADWGAHAHLLAVPGIIWVALLQHEDEVLREMQLHLSAHPELPVGGPQNRLDLPGAGRALHQLVAASGESRTSVPLGAADAVELLVAVGVTGVSDFTALQRVLDYGSRLAREGLTLVGAEQNEVSALRDWACEQVIAQLNDLPSLPWTSHHQSQALQRLVQTENKIP